MSLPADRTALDLLDAYLEALWDGTDLPLRLGMPFHFASLDLPMTRPRAGGQPRLRPEGPDRKVDQDDVREQGQPPGASFS